ncbi:MAG TPA: chromate efflux transporter [Paracoccus sp. (in: a-proteobacteria)]|uniref:chromate efflux transporter n=1 Tax=uncultured Paracoccus sp. TaxID=189685 RepID=UPI00261BE90D|nr:chromate efflux transporter [uncultured Paracoccus sp.]HMQ41895.1 chromate efflux transporter [Paracoccus sp. (in: a-proteobacteria)]HMR37427.1 chromate efflux transporter [Paracoccus sp. (in: a-proteobacteria)]
MTSNREIFLVFHRIGWLSFGGPAGQIALMHGELVERRHWLSEQQFLRALSLCMLLPGPEATQLAAYAGWRLRGIPGGLIAGGLFVLPGAMVIAALAAAYATWGQLPLVQAAFLGIKAAVLAVVVQALLRVSQKALKGRAHRQIALAAFLAIAGFSLPFPLVILTAAAVGTMMRPVLTEFSPAPHPAKSLAILLPGIPIWLAPVGLAWAMGSAFLTTLGIFFAKLAIVSFGGAYAVLTYMTQTVVQDLGWLSTGQMIDALGLAETTPGPLILVTEFVAWQAGNAQGGPAMAAIAALLCLWVTFVPSFLFIFAFAPSIDWLASRPRLSAALEGVTAAVVGVIATLALWFGAQVLFGGDMLNLGPISLPDPAALDWRAALIALGAGLALLRFQAGLLPVLGASAMAGLLLAG